MDWVLVGDSQQDQNSPQKPGQWSEELELNSGEASTALKTYKMATFCWNLRGPLGRLPADWLGGGPPSSPTGP